MIFKSHLSKESYKNPISGFKGKASCHSGLILYFCFTSLLFFFNPSPTKAQSNNSASLTHARNELPEAYKSEKACLALYEKLNQISKPEPVLLGYKGAVTIAMSKHAPLTEKLGYLNNGKAILEEAIKQLPGNTELIFLRLTIQLNLPSFLGYNSNIKEDKKFILDNYPNTPPVLKKRIQNFVMESEDFTQKEKTKIKGD